MSKKSEAQPVGEPLPVPVDEPVAPPEAPPVVEQDAPPAFVSFVACWTVKMNGQRYEAGDPIDPSPEHLEALLAAGAIREA